MMKSLRAFSSAQESSSRLLADGSATDTPAISTSVMIASTTASSTISADADC